MDTGVQNLQDIVNKLHSLKDIDLLEKADQSMRRMSGTGKVTRHVPAAWDDDDLVISEVLRRFQIMTSEVSAL